MEIEEIKKLMSAMDEAGLTKISIKEKTGFELHLERQKEPAANPQMSHPPYAMVRHDFPHIHQGAHPHPHHHIPHQAGMGEMPKVEEKVVAGKFVTSPMVGTFYLASSPEHPPFVKVGDQVNENTVVCIIEAMKVMNEIKAGMSGVITEICLDNSHPVEFGTKLFRIS